jgi:integrase
MAKIPYLYRRNNIYYFRLRVPAQLRASLKVCEIIQSLKTESRAEAIPLALRLAASVTVTFNELKTVNKACVSHLEVIRLAKHDLQIDSASGGSIGAISALDKSQSTVPLLSVVVDDFLKRYDPSNKATFTKLNATLPIFVELIGNKAINQILQADVNSYFEEVQKLPVRRDAKIFSGMSFKEIIAANTGACIAEGKFKSTYRACVSLFIQWATVHYKDQGFPDLSVKGGVYRGVRSGGVNKQRAMKLDELQTLFRHKQMERYASNHSTAHYYWLPLIGLYTGARINEICQLNPSTDIVLDNATGIHYFHFTDDGETISGVDKSIKTKSSKRIVPIHSKLQELGFLEYVAKIQQAKQKILFIEWEPRNGKASANASKWFVRYLAKIGLSDETEGGRLSGFHSFRHTFITWGIANKIADIFSITGHEVESVDGFEKISAVAKGYWTREITDNILAKQVAIEKFDYGLDFYRPML